MTEAQWDARALTGAMHRQNAAAAKYIADLKRQNAGLREALEGLLREDEAVGSYTIALSDARKKARAALEEARRS